MSPLRSFDAHAATPLLKAGYPTWTRPAAQPVAQALKQWSQNYPGTAPGLEIRGLAPATD